MGKLSITQIAISLTMTHYGLGFLIGTGQDIAEFGAAGMLYAFSTAVGLLTLIPIAGYYWKNKKPIWKIFEEHHGSTSGKTTAFLSSFWMLGVIASQILGGAVALMAFGVPQFLSASIIASLILILSYLDLGKLSKLFFYFLLLSSVLVILPVLKYGVENLSITPLLFIQAIPNLPIEKLLGITLTTIFITFIGMDFHQFIIAADSKNAARKGALWGFILLAILTTILGSSIMGFLKNNQFSTNSTLAAAQVVPQMLIQTGVDLLGKWGGFFFLLPIILVSAGSGSAVTKVVVRAGHDMLPAVTKSKSYNAVIIMLCTLLTLLSQSVVELIVSFYATYVGAILIPFLIVGLEEKNLLHVKDNTFNAAIFLGFALSLSVFLISKLNLVILNEVSVYMLIAGLIGSATVLGASILHKHIARLYIKS